MIRKMIVASILLVLVCIPTALQCSDGIDKMIDKADDTRDKTFSNVESIQSSSPPIVPPNITTEYDINYRLTDYGKIIDYNNGYPTINQITDVIGITRFQNSTSPIKSYRAQALRNGTIYIFNLTNVGVAGPSSSEVDLVKGFDWDYLGKWNLDTTVFDPQKLFGDSPIDNQLVFAGMNKTDNSAMIVRIQFDEQTSTFNYLLNYSIPKPSLFNSISNVKVYSTELPSTGVVVNYYGICGKYINGTENIPFSYRGYLINGTVVGDYTNLTTSTTDHKQFGEAIFLTTISNIYSIYSLDGVYIITNKYLMFLGGSGSYNVVGKKILWKIDLLEEIPVLSNLVTRFSKMYTGTLSTDIIAFDYYTGGTFFRSFLFTNYNFSVYRLVRREFASLLTQPIEEDTIFSTNTDIRDGLIIFGQDNNLEIWQDWIVSSGSVGGVFDAYVSFSIIVYPSVFFDDFTRGNFAFEIWYGDSRGIWYAHFSNNNTGILKIGDSKVSRIVSQRVSVTHDKGSDVFGFSVSGYVERTSNEVVDVGIIPIYAQPFTFSTVDPIMLSIRNIHIFTNRKNGGVLLRPVVSFIGVGSNVIEFQATFSSMFCPITEVVLGTRFVTFTVFYVIWERYSNGTFTQRLFRDVISSKSAFIISSYVLGTILSVQDSHLLDEIHVFVDGIEYNPFDLFFTSPEVLLLVTDKRTNDILYNGTAIFMDPLPVPIPSKYEFNIRYFSNFDKFGFDFSLLNTFINGTQISVDSVRILSENAEIVVTDFSNSVIRRIVVNKYIDGAYINIGLDVVNVIFMNKYNFTIDLYLSREGTSIYYQLPSGAAISLRLALGDYTYRVTNVNGTELIDEKFKLDAAFGVTIGSTVITFGEPTPLIAGLTIDDIIAISLITLMLVFVLITFATLISRARSKSPEKSVFGSKPKPKKARPNGGYLRV